MKYFGAFLLIVGLAGVAGNFYIQEQLPELKTSIFDLVEEAQNAGMSVDKWQKVSVMAKDEIPPLPGLFRIRNAFGEVPEILDSVNALQKEFSDIDPLSESIPITKVNNTFVHLREIDESLENIEKAINIIPNWIITKEILRQKQEGEAQIALIRESLANVLELESIITRWAERQERLIVILQNPNEPRSTGGFMGSLLVIDFQKENVTWKFQDIYAIDRKIPQEKLILTPDWFQGLSQYLSLRDANFWPDFPTSAGEIRNLFVLAGEKSPETVIAITPEWVKVWLELIGGTRMSKWNVNFTPENFDLVLQFLVESKIEGRWGVKKPIMKLAEQLFAPYSVSRITPEKVAEIDWKTLVAEKHILAHSRDKKLQEILEEWNITGHVQQENDADNFLAFDFISIGANKSEKFIWSRLEHNSRIAPDGAVENTLKITRTHALRPGEISQQLGEKKWSQNVRDLLTPDILWKLGAGENRTMLRVWIPHDSEFISGTSPSGNVRFVPRAEKDFTMLEIPMNVLPGESLVAEVKYKTHIARGSSSWRPYNLQIVGTPARKQTKLIPTISAVGNGKFTAETMNVGAPISLLDTNVRAVVKFDCTLSVDR